MTLRRPPCPRKGFVFYVWMVAEPKDFIPWYFGSDRGDDEATSPGLFSPHLRHQYWSDYCGASGSGGTCGNVKFLYEAYVPNILGCWTARGRSAALRKLADEVFGKQKFDIFKTNVGIVATRWEDERQ